MNILLSIVVPTHFRHQNIRLLLDSLVKAEVPTGLSLELLIISNLQDSKLENELKHSPKMAWPIRSEYVGSIGVNKARNRGVQLASEESKFILFLDDDTEIDDGHFFEKLKAAIEGSSFDAVGGYYRLGSYNLVGLAYYLKMKTWLEFFSNDHEATRLVGGLMLIKKSIFDIYKFDDQIIFGGSETEFIYQLVQAHKKIKLNKDLYVKHNFSVSFFGFVKKIYLQAKQNYKFNPDFLKSPYHIEFKQMQENNLKELQLSVLKRLGIRILFATHRFIFWIAKFN